MEGSGNQCAELVGQSEDPIINAVIDYQFKLIARRDSGPHIISQARAASS